MLLRRGSVATILFITYVRIIMYALLCLLKSKFGFNYPLKKLDACAGGSAGDYYYTGHVHVSTFTIIISYNNITGISTCIEHRYYKLLVPMGRVLINRAGLAGRKHKFHGHHSTRTLLV